MYLHSMCEGNGASDKSSQNQLDLFNPRLRGEDCTRWQGGFHLMES